MKIEDFTCEFERYPAYKDSGVDWLGEIPEGWEMKPNKYIFSIKKDIVGKKHSKFNLLSLTLKGIILRNLDNGGKFPVEFNMYQEVKKGDFVFCLFDVEETPRTVGLSRYDGMITGAYTVMTVNNSFSREFLYYYYLNLDSHKNLKLLYRGLRNTIPKESFLSFKTPIPPLKEQISISNFLDEKCNKIDKLIAQKEKMISLLEERKKILIQNAVTKGLNPDVKMKDSGVEWIGEIPEDWEVKRLKQVTNKIGSGITPSGGGTVYLSSGGVPLIRSQNVHFEGLRFDDVARISKRIHMAMSNSHVLRGDVLLNITGGSLGRCYFVETDKPLNVNQHVCIIRPSIINTIYLNYLLASNIGQSQIWYFQQGGGREGLNFKALKNLFVILPKSKEQRDIVSYVQDVNTKLNLSKEIQITHINKLKEYKSILINSLVTGQIKIL